MKKGKTTLLLELELPNINDSILYTPSYDDFDEPECRTNERKRHHRY